MGHSPEQRDKHSLCGAMTKRGVPCRAFAGQGTDHPGVGKCKFHLGSTPTGKKNAAAIEARQRMVKLGAPLDIKPREALLGVLRATSGHVAWLHHEVTHLEDLAAHEARVMMELYDSERDRLVRIADACTKAGIEQAEIRITQQTAEAFVEAVENAAKAIGGWNPKQRRQFGDALRMELMMASESAAETPAALFERTSAA